MKRIGWIVLVAACSSAPPPPPPSPPPAAPQVKTASVSLETAGVTSAWMTKGTDPCADFYKLACGEIQDHAEIPADRSAWGPGYELVERNELFLRDLLERGVEKKTAAWYAACMDEARIEKQGLAPLAELLKAVDGVKDQKTLHAAIIELHRHDIGAIFSITSQQDYKDATQVIAALDQSGLGLPDRDYYLLEDARTKDIRTFYRAYVEKMLVLAKEKGPAAKKLAGDVLRVETELAKLAQDKVERRDPYKYYHRINRDGLLAAAPKFPWNDYFAALGFPELKDITVNSVEYFKGAGELMQKIEPAAWRAYLRFIVLDSESNRLPKAFVDHAFEMRKKMAGQEKNAPRWRRCVDSTDAALGEILGQEYVKAKFDAESKALAESVVEGVRGAMKAELDTLPWMDADTRKPAQEKLAKMFGKIGYPSRWRTYDFDVGPDYAKNAIASDMYELKRMLAKVGKPVDREEWLMTPPTVNAYYEASLNEMVFPAGVLQPPYFSKTFSAAVNYGSTGGTVGHELTHGFDDEGSQFDANGNLRDWWSESTRSKFKTETKCVIDQYAQYEAIPGVKLNGELTAGENIADIGGVKLAYKAFQTERAARRERITAGGYTEEQLFFLGFAQSWCTKVRPELQELIAKTDPHSPPRYRVNGSLANVPQFSEAFACKVGSPMRPEKSCSVW